MHLYSTIYKVLNINSALAGPNINRYCTSSSLAHVQKHELTYEDTNPYLVPNCLAYIYIYFPSEAVIHTRIVHIGHAFYLSCITILSEMIVVSFKDIKTN